MTIHLSSTAASPLDSALARWKQQDAALTSSDLEGASRTRGLRYTGLQLWREGHQIVNVDARVSHYSPRGWRFFWWRALVTGRDADRKFVELHSSSRAQRVVKSFSRWATMSWRTTRRVIRHAPQTGMPLWQIPFSLAVGLAFYTLAFLGHFSLAAGLVRDKIETVPDYVGHS